MLVIFQLLFSDGKKATSLKTLKKHIVKQAFLTLKNSVKNSSFEASKTVLFETVFESQKSLFYVGFYSVLNDFDFCSSLTSSYKVAKKEVNSILFELF